MADSFGPYSSTALGATPSGGFGEAGADTTQLLITSNWGIRCLMMSGTFSLH